MLVTPINSLLAVPLSGMMIIDATFLPHCAPESYVPRATPTQPYVAFPLVSVSFTHKTNHTDIIPKFHLHPIQVF